MKYLIILLAFWAAHVFPGSSVSTGEFRANALEGAWELETVNGEHFAHRAVLLIEEPYVFYTEFDEEGKRFIGSQGGMVEIIANKLFYTNEFNTWDESQIGQRVEMTAELKANKVTFSYTVGEATNTMVFNRIDTGNSDLAGAWRITDRMQEGEMRAMSQGARKTIKVITGTRFQWAAYNPENKQFSGTGGGTISLKDGKYTEHIEFFSRNPDRVGASLTFNYEVNGSKWVHSGLSSAGEPIKEIWTRQ
ncbi:membrane or secreted protein [Roseivirga sp. UBA1976]|uniref:membrane or secreted protein n=1 Tax=Roseivirga sp. UBA1976 TaxID=1947386 RepID=UPI00257F1101|nr:membrane or secreted protein [Roseivirga sp. UBA1976]MEC7754261.1 membrane or secreted protein [Bacteroidota bacterium]|tara:strand:- start:317 stop:1063 length:747 start_codon:yes stop_codon:yes gene_type:complete